MTTLVCSFCGATPARMGVPDAVPYDACVGEPLCERCRDSLDLDPPDSACSSKYVVVYGNPFEGMKACGPFETHDEAEREVRGLIIDWWIVPLLPPDAPIEKPPLWTE